MYSIPILDNTKALIISNISNFFLKKMYTNSQKMLNKNEIVFKNANLYLGFYCMDKSKSTPK